MGWFSKVGSFIKENAHTILDVAGMIPGVGAVADIANAALYAAEGDWANAAMSAVSAIPGIGDTVAMANKGLKVAKGVKTALKGGKSLKAILKAGGKSMLKAIKGKAKVGASFLKKLNPKNLYKNVKNKMKNICLFGKCFTGDTLVYTDKGYVPISEIKVGDLVFSRKESTGETGFKKVEQISQTEAHTIHSIEVNGNVVINTTAYHRFFVEQKGWINAINLLEGDLLLTPDGLMRITKVSRQRYEEAVSMYNLHVEEWVSYFVSELKIYVHNGGKHYKKISDMSKDTLKTKPLNSPNVKKWYKNGGTVSVDKKNVWTFHDGKGNHVRYPNGYPDFKGAGMVKKEAPIGPFAGRNKDFRKAKKMGYDKPRGTTWHHSEDGSTLQAVSTRMHTRFSHRGGISKMKKR